MKPAIDDKDYRLAVDAVFKKIAAAFDDVDPDLAEAELSAGSCTILTPKNKSKIIVSPQPPVKQIWLAAAALGVAVHFNWEQGQSKWLDDKEQGLELFSYLEKLILDTVGISIHWSR